MQLWLFLVIIIGGLFLFAFIFDFIMKRKGKEIDLETGIKNATEAERVYGENFAQSVRDEINRHF